MKIKQADSKLVSHLWTVDTTHYNIRTEEICRITPHHVANGTGCNKGYASNTNAVTFASVGANGSVQYAIDSNGTIDQWIPEKYRAWTSNSRSNDMKAVTIEVANCAGSSTWAISDKALASLVNLCEDICRRHNKKKLLWLKTKTQSLNYKPTKDEMVITLHKWVSDTPTPCPEQYMESKMGYIASEVTKRLGGKDPAPAFQPYLVKITYKQGVNVRKGPGVNYAKTGILLPYNGVYTIVEEKINGTQTWGKLKSGVGWICLTGFTTVVK